MDMTTVAATPYKLTLPLLQSMGTFRAKHRAGASASQWRRMAFHLLDEVEMAASSRQIGPTAS